MKLKFSVSGKADSRWFVMVRHGFVAAVFLIGIICSLGTSLGKFSEVDKLFQETRKGGPSMATDEELNEISQDIAKLQKENDNLGRQLAVEKNPKERAELSYMITANKEVIAEEQRFIDGARAIREIRSSSGCFTADMQVYTDQGTRSIEKIKVGDKVLSMDAEGRQVVADVIGTYAGRNNHYFLINGNLKVTALHRFHTNHGWKRAKELDTGDHIQTVSGAFEKISSIEWVAADDLAVFNLSIEGNHNFFVSPEGRRSYLVHNGGGGK